MTKYHRQVNIDFQELLEQKYFDLAVEFVGEEWLEEKHREYYEDDEDYSGDYLPQITEDPPEIVKQYRIAKEDLTGELEDNPLNFQEYREATHKFLRLGRVYENIEDCQIIHPSGELIDDSSPQDMYQKYLREDGEYENRLFELETADKYIIAGHEPAFIDETKTQSKSPDIELTDLDKKVQVECKRCGKESDQAKKESNRVDLLFNGLLQYIESDKYIALFDLDRVPSREEVDALSAHLTEKLELEDYKAKKIELQFGTLYLIDFPYTSPLNQSISGVEGSEIIADFHEMYVRPVLKQRLDIDKSFEEFGNITIMTESMRGNAVIKHRNPIWIGVKEKIHDDDPMSRLRNQFRGVSKKFDDCVSILHIDFPQFREGDSLQEMELRKTAGGELKERPEISAAVVSGLIIDPVFSDGRIKRKEIPVPNYNPNHELPNSLYFVGDDFGSLVSGDQLFRDLDDELMRDPEGLSKAIGQEEGTLSFRFKPEEERDIETKKHIISVKSKDNQTKLELNILPNEHLSLERLDASTGYWNCTLDISEIPEFDPLKIFIVWSDDELSLSIGSNSTEELITSETDSPDADVIEQDGELITKE